MTLCNVGHTFDYETEKICRLFFPFEKIEIKREANLSGNTAVTEYTGGDKPYGMAFVTFNGKTESRTVYVSDAFGKEELAVSAALFSCLVSLTGYKPEWGMLTGIRPAKLFLRTAEEFGTEYARRFFSEAMFVSENKISLCEMTAKREKSVIDLSRDNSFSLYLSVPFCPTRCSYCSFISSAAEHSKKLIPEYVDLICRELEVSAAAAKNAGLKLETVYIGGGTPTVLSAEQLDTVMKTVSRFFDISSAREYTVEAGRPDTVTVQKLSVIKQNGADRISINPQTMNDAVLREIGRAHTSEQMYKAFYLAREMGFDNINTDLIAGLPTDTTESFYDTLDKITELSPENVTVHSLSMKRASTLNLSGATYGENAGSEAARMVDGAFRKLSENGITPYYMYRQSKTVGNLENVGYAKAGREGLYNVYIMDETHTIIACGASAVTKLRAPDGSIERVFNYKYPFEYISRFDEILNRKTKIGEFYDKYAVVNK